MEATVAHRFLLREALVLRTALSDDLHRPRLESRCPIAAVNLIRVHRLEECPNVRVGAPLPRRTAVQQHRRHQFRTLPRLETTRQAIQTDVLFQYDFKDVACRYRPRQRGARPPDRGETSARPAHAAHRPPEPPTMDGSRRPQSP